MLYGRNVQAILWGVWLTKTILKRGLTNRKLG